MARKRASMREGPLAELFRKTEAAQRSAAEGPQPEETTVEPGGADRPLNGVLSRPAADALGISPLRNWREELADYMKRAALTASPT